MYFQCPSNFCLLELEHGQEDCSRKKIFSTVVNFIQRVIKKTKITVKSWIPGEKAVYNNVHILRIQEVDIQCNEGRNVLLQYQSVERTWYHDEYDKWYETLGNFLTSCDRNVVSLRRGVDLLTISDRNGQSSWVKDINL